MKRRLRTRRGFTLVEGLVAAGISALVMLGAVVLLLTAGAAWGRGQSKIDATGGAQASMRIIDAELREATKVTVDSDGKGLTYQLPVKDGQGNYVVPVASDGVDRRIEFATVDGSLVVRLGPTASKRVIMRGALTTDPDSNVSFKPFTPGPGSTVRSVKVRLMTSFYGSHSERMVGSAEETVNVRNAPVLIQ